MSISDKGAASVHSVWRDLPDANDPLTMTRDDVDRIVTRLGAEGAAAEIAARATARLRSVKLVVEHGADGARARLARHDREVTLADEERRARHAAAMRLHENLQFEASGRDTQARYDERGQLLVPPRSKHDIKADLAAVERMRARLAAELETAPESPRPSRRRKKQP